LAAASTSLGLCPRRLFATSAHASGGVLVSWPQTGNARLRRSCWGGGGGRMGGGEGGGEGGGVGNREGLGSTCVDVRCSNRQRRAASQELQLKTSPFCYSRFEQVRYHDADASYPQPPFLFEDEGFRRARRHDFFPERPWMKPVPEWLGGGWGLGRAWDSLSGRANPRVANVSSIDRSRCWQPLALTH